MQIEPLVKDRLEILHGEDVVRRLQQLCQRAHAPCDRLLPRRRKRDAGLQLGAQVFAQQRIEQRLPKLKCVTTPRLPSSPTAPRANPSADDSAHGSGSSSTRSAPQRAAVSARANFAYTAGLPRCTKSPDMTHTTGQSAPRRARVCSMSRAWPL